MTLDKSKERPLVSFDWAIKRLLWNKANYEVVEGFLSELLKRQILEEKDKEIAELKRLLNMQ